MRIRDVVDGPKERSLDLSAVRRLGIFLMARNTEKTFYLDNVHLN